MSGKTCGFVPTLGALHEGHLSLIKRAKRENDKVIVSLFVNPLQFRSEGYRKYPRDPEGDAEMCRKAGVDLLFAPKAEEIYPEGFSASLELPALFKVLKFQKLEWHYRGMLLIVLKLFNIVRPRRAYFGMKDPHQLSLICKMVDDLNVPVEIVPCPTVRERDGLAKSSRNRLLTPEERKALPIVYRALKSGAEMMTSKGVKGVDTALKSMRDIFRSEPLVTLHGLEILYADTLMPVGSETHGAKVREAFCAATVFAGGKRLTDNVRFKIKPI